MTKILFLCVLLVPFLTACSENDESALLKPDDSGEKPVSPDPSKNDEIPNHDFVMGALFSFQKNLRNGVDAYNGGTASTTFYNQPMFEAKDFSATNEEWWDNLVEEMAYSGLDYVAANCRGRLPKADTESKYELDHGDPTRLAGLLDAFKRRGVDDIKVAIFDDCPASWAAARNFNLYGQYSTVLNATQQKELNLSDADVVYPLDKLDDIYPYIWDYNIKLAFENFYGKNQENNKYLFRYNGKPVLYIWSPNGFLNVTYAALGNQRPDCTGKLKEILDKIHADFKAAFGEELFICVDKAFMDRDSKVNKTVVEATNNWFVASEQTTSRHSYSLASTNNINVGVAVPGFLTNDKQGNRMLFDANHGKTLTDALDYFIKYKANLILLEGFTDMAENAAYWRSTDTKYYDFPNQRLNILRKYSSTRAYPESMRVEAEACDYYKDNSTGNSGLQYRKGDLDVKRCTDGFNSWCVTHTEAGEWLRWVELPFRAGTSVIRLRYAAKETAKVRFDVDGKEGTTVTLPATGGNWSNVDAATCSFDVNGWREVVLNVIEGSPDLNSFTIVGE